jgi:PilZ domain
MNQDGSTERRRHSRLPSKLSFEYWETADSRYGGLIGNLSKTGLLIYSIHDMPIGTEFIVKVFFFNGYGLDAFAVVAKTIWKDPFSAGDYSGHKYGLAFTQISEDDHSKLSTLLNNRLWN